MGTKAGVEADKEFELKAVHWTSAVVNRHLGASFPAAGVAEAAVVLSGLVGEDPGGDPDVSDLAVCRMMLAAVKLAEGDLCKLALWVEAARQDPRDLIAAAEYPRQLGGGGAQARREDLDDYLAWVTAATPNHRA